MDNREGRILRDRRLELGLTQEEIALELGMSLHQYQRYEYGETTLSNADLSETAFPESQTNNEEEHNT